MIPRLNFSCWGLNCTSTYLYTAPMCQQELVLMLSPSQTVMQGLVKVPLRRDILICVNTSAGVDQGAVASTGRGPSPSCVWVVCVDVRLQLLDGSTVWTELCWKEIQCIFPAFSQNYAKLRRHKSTFVSVQSMSYFLLFPVRPRDREEAGFSTCSPRCGVYVLEWQAWHASQAFHCNVCAPRPTRRRRRSSKQHYIDSVFVTLLSQFVPVLRYFTARPKRRRRSQHSCH